MSRARLDGTRLSALFTLASLACSPPQPTPAERVPRPNADTAPTPPALASSAPSDLAGLTGLHVPAGVCTVRGTLNDEGMTLSASPSSMGFAHVSQVFVTLAIGSEGNWAEAHTDDWTLRGHVVGDVKLAAAQRVVVGGVYVARPSETLDLQGLHGDKLVVAPPVLAGFTWTHERPTSEVACADVELVSALQSPLGASGSSTDAFPEKGGTLMRLVRKTPVPVSIEASSAPLGSFDAGDKDLDVDLLERSGSRAHVRWGPFVGWVDGSTLRPKNKLTERQRALRTAAEFGMGGVLGLGDEGDMVGPTDGPYTTLVCPANVRVIVETRKATAAEPPVRVTVGTLRAGKVFRVVERSAELTSVLVDRPPQWRAGTRAMSVPTRDLSADCKPGPEDPPRAVGGLLGTPHDPVASIFGSEDGGTLGLVTGSSILDPDGGLGGALGGGSLGAFGTLGHVGHPTVDPILEINVDSSSLAQEIVRRIVRRSSSSYRHCYEAALEQRPSLSGTLVARIAIDGAGQVTSVTYTSSSLSDATAASCIHDQLKQLSFPSPPAGPCAATVKLVFSPVLRR